ncbi:hypothetical protein ACSYAY_01075 [Leptospirillum ferriphilum]|uniref:Uncharacterized protein n=1 Tax=Leptospirillum ferriphilum TaxID=178606 RepID=A0A1V3SVB3_9BACT|nr:hypothetical protein [Leptospirillum ferriphilum]OOH72806.1 hypothetical protein BOX24_05300 [Leptospirillum ferriphilum]
MTRGDLIKILIGLSGKSPSRIAEEAGLHRTGVLRWIKGGGGIGARAQNKLLSVLGVSGGTLASDRVHRWTINQNLDPLREILAWVGEEFENIVLIPQNTQVKDWLTNSHLFLLHSSPKSIRILIYQRVSPMVPDREIQILGSESIPFVKCPEISKGFQIDQSFSKKLLNPQSEISAEEFDQFFESLKKSGNRAEPQNLPEALSTERLKEIRARMEDWSVDSGVLREDIRTLLDHIEPQEGK